ncbi:Hsp70 family protein [Paenarthrobacter sp. NPDC089675]|uniref:Hsp70 family protein n=1 Tax=Paenarthrobacter sp. NPDC089675 TaxID=3364376 RepID=UPI0038015ED0
MSYVLAIDVGTSFTAAAVLRYGQEPATAPEILPLGLHGSAVPSVLYYADNGRVLVGEAAERRGLDDPKRVVREFKRRIGDSVPLAVGDGWLAPEDVFAAMAAWVADKAAEREGSPATSIVLTYPAAWGRHRTSTVLAALNLAGLAAVSLISEPEAAALHYVSQTKVEDGSTIAVYDLGGGTFDTAILRKAGAGNFELLGHPDGLETLGGADFDAAVLRYLASHLGEALTGLDPADPVTLAALSRLRRECREAKEALSLDSEASISVSLPGTQQSIRLVRAEFESLIEHHVRETLDALERSLQSVELEPGDLSAVLLIGGSSRIPLVAELISAELGRPIAVDADPKSSICLGAAVSALPAVLPVPDKADQTVATPTVGRAAGVATQGALARAGVVHRPSALSALRAGALRTAAAGSHGAQPGRHAPRTRVRMTAAAAAAATVLTMVTATAAQSPDGKDLLSIFASQATDVMRDGGGQPAGPAGGAGDGAAGSVAAGGQPDAGLDASARTGTSRTSTGTGPSGRKGSQPAGGSGSAAVPGTGSVAPGAPLPGSTAPGASNPGTSNPGTSNPGASTPLPTTPGGAASGPTPDPSTPPPVVQPTTPPVVTPTTPADPPPATVPDPVTPAPQPTTQAPPPPATQDPAPVPSDPVTEPAPAPPPTETTPSQEPAPAAVV